MLREYITGLVDRDGRQELVLWLDCELRELVLSMDLDLRDLCISSQDLRV
jgi:hypothetical protein